MKLRRLLRDKLGRRGVAAVEFAIIAPVLLVLFIGTIEILTLYRTEAKLNAVAFNVAQMVSIAQSVSTAKAPIADAAATAFAPAQSVTSLNDICQGAILGLQPFPPSGMAVAIASVTEESGPSGQPSTSTAYSSSPTYDKWEADSTVSGNTCNTVGGTAILSAVGANAPLTVATSPPDTAMVENPCDNVIIVQASLSYPGLTGLILRSRPTLTQTAYVRWRYTAPTSELNCTGCTLNNAATRVCASGNTATN